MTRLLTCSRLNVYPLFLVGTAEILMAFPRLIEKHPKLRLVLVGFGTYREHLELMLHCMVTGNKELFKAAGHCPDEEGHTFLETSIDIDEHFMQISKYMCGHETQFRVSVTLKVRRIIRFYLFF